MLRFTELLEVNHTLPLPVKTEKVLLVQSLINAAFQIVRVDAIISSGVTGSILVKSPWRFT